MFGAELNWKPVSDRTAIGPKLDEASLASETHLISDEHFHTCELTHLLPASDLSH